MALVIARTDDEQAFRIVQYDHATIVLSTAPLAPATSITSHMPAVSFTLHGVPSTVHEFTW